MFKCISDGINMAPAIMREADTLPKPMADTLVYIYKKLGYADGNAFIGHINLTTTRRYIEAVGLPLDVDKVPNRLFTVSLGDARVRYTGSPDGEDFKEVIEKRVRDYYLDYILEPKVDRRPVDIIKSLFKSGKISDREISKKTGIPQPTVSRYHNGSRKIGFMGLDTGGKLLNLYHDLKIQEFKKR